MSNNLISRSELKKVIKTECNPYGKLTIDFESGKRVLKIIDNALTVKSRMFYIQETVNTILNRYTGNTDIDKAFRNAARLVQNAIDGEPVDFEEIERSYKE